MLDNMSDSDTNSSRTTLAANPNLVDPALLDKIDKLFTCGVGCEVDLPQLVVVGQQSSGKSSVLEGLTGIPFPRHNQLCTRFATRITFRRAVTSSVRASVVSPPDSGEEDAKEIERWTRTMQSLEADTFAEVMEQARSIMGIDQTVVDDSTNSSSFSTDILSLEIMGPEQEHFRIIDVPGIFSVPIPGVTTKSDIPKVTDIVEGYMYSPRSIMLVVVMANTDVAVQGIIQRATDIDPDGQRTLGILTKPDMIDKGAEGTALDILENRTLPLKLGWHMLRNPGQADLYNEHDPDRTCEAQFFRSVIPWRSVSKDKLGVATLKVRLRRLLGEHLERELPNVQKEIDVKLAETVAELEKLGPKRESQFEHMQYLMKVAQDYRDAAEAAARGDFGRINLDDPHLRLANIVVTRSDSFSTDVALTGHEYAWLKEDIVPGTTSIPAASTGNKPTSQEPASVPATAPPLLSASTLIPDSTRKQPAPSAFATAAGASIFGSTATPFSVGTTDTSTKVGPYRPPAPFTDETLSSDGVSFEEHRYEAVKKTGRKADPKRASRSPTPVDGIGAQPANLVITKLRSPPSTQMPVPFAFSLPPSVATSMQAKSAAAKISTRQIPMSKVLGLTLSAKDIPIPPKEGIAAWLEDLYATTRGYELGTFAPQLVGMMMRAQANKWERLAMGYTSDIICVVHRFMVALLHKLVPSPRTRMELLDVLAKELEKGYQGALDHAHFLLKVELELDPATQNHYFNEELQKHRVKRFRAAQAAHDPDSKDKLVDHLVTHMSNAKYTARELHDTLEAYYKVARKRFVDNVRMQVVDWFLVKGPASPLKVFSPAFVATLDANQLDRIVGEEPGTRMKRHKLLKQVKRLEEGKRILEG